MIRKIFLIIAALAALLPSVSASSGRDKILINNGWTFHLGNAADKMADFTHGTEYFTYLTKIRSADHNTGPAMPSFDDSDWQIVNLPHDWAVDLPFSGEAGHSHGYKCIGPLYPANSVGWYRKHITIPESDRGMRILVEFEGIFRNAEVFCNGIYLGRELSGYASRTYDITEYVLWGQDNLLTVRADASTEEGWFYEGAGIYRNVYLHKAGPVSVKPYGVAIREMTVESDGSWGTIQVETAYESILGSAEEILVAQLIIDADGKVVAQVSDSEASPLEPFSEGYTEATINVPRPHLWSLEDPYLYTLRTLVYKDSFASENLLDTYEVRIGFRTVAFDPDNGFFLNGERVQLKGVDLHLDHAGVGVALPDELWRYRIGRLKLMGANAIRSSHNPASPAMLDICDELGMLVIDENRLMGINEEQLTLVRRMVERDINHPSVILWSVGNEEWSLEWDVRGTQVARRMSGFIHGLDRSRPTTYGSSSGRDLVLGVDVFGYNYVIQNPIEEYHKKFPDHAALGTEETTGAGTRGKYQTVPEKGWMLSLNRSGVAPDTINGSDEGWPLTADGKVENVIERGQRYYSSRQWLGGQFYWTGFDYRGEANPMVWPATGSQFGVMDYCGFFKDEAYYLQSCWTDEPVLYISPHWNNPVPQGEQISIWAYSNLDEVQLSVNGRNLGRHHMPHEGHLSWNTVYRPGKIVAKGYRKGKLVKTLEYVTTGTPFAVKAVPHKESLKADGQDIIVCDLTVVDEKGREVPDADIPLTVSVEGPATLLGWGNGDPGFKAVERPTRPGPFEISSFSGRAQILIRSIEGEEGTVVLNLTSDTIQPLSLIINSQK